jgi:hypothetical protein
MKLLDSLKPLFADSTLFKDPKATQANSSKKRKGGPVKIGQGGTLDPLADGVLGTFILPCPLSSCPCRSLQWLGNTD